MNWKKHTSKIQNKITHNLSEPTQNRLNELITLVNSGELVKAEEMSLDITRQFPKSGVGWKIYGYVLWQKRSLSEALLALQNSIKYEPNDPESFNNLGNIYKDLGDLQSARENYLRSISLKPSFPQAQNNLGVVLNELNLLDEAENCFKKAICQDSLYAEAYNNYANLLYKQNKFIDSKQSYLKALSIRPDYAQAHNNLGVLLGHLGMLKEAEISYRAAIRLQPNYANALSNLGILLSDAGQMNEAESNFRAAIHLDPSNARTQSNYGNFLRDLGRLSESEERHRKAIALDTNYAEAHSNLANTLKEMRRFSESIASHRSAIQMNFNRPEVHSNLLFTSNYIDTIAPEQVLEDSKRYGELISTKSQPKFTHWNKDCDLEKIKIGFVSGDLRNHPVGFFTEDLIQKIDKTKFTLIAFTTVPAEDELTNRIKCHFHEWVPIYGKTDLEAATLIHNLNIHILIDLSGHTAKNRLPVFSYRPAPVQCTWLGYFATTGLKELDFFIGDPWMAPKESSAHFVESILNLPETWLCMTAPTKEVEITQLPFLANGFVTFGCFGNLAKMGHSVVLAWAAILKRVPNSRLYLKSKYLADLNSKSEVQKQFYDHGITEDRLILDGPSPRMQYFESYNYVDIILDTFPYPGGTTSCDALWMGVPVLTIKGDRFLSRLGESIAQNSGQSDWIAENRDDYVERAVKFASNPDHLTFLRSTLREKVLYSPLFDTQRFAKNFEILLEYMYQEKMPSIL